MNIQSLSWLILSICIALITSTCGTAVSESPQISVESPWVRSASTASIQSHSHDSQPSMGNTDTQVTSINSAAYMLIRNPGKQADKLLKVDCDAAESAEMHLSQTENDITTMKMVTHIEIPAQGKIELKPGGFHIMMVNLKRNLNPGDKVILRLQFEISGEIIVEAEIREQ